jgi:hypothetical protein
MIEWGAFVGRLTLFPVMPPSGSLPSAHDLKDKILFIRICSVTQSIRSPLGKQPL